MSAPEDLFGTIPEQPKRVVDPRVSKAAKTMAEARQAAKRGAMLAQEHADRVSVGWSSRADMLCEMYARNVAPAAFLVEDASAFAQAQGLEPPPDGRAWGHVPKRLSARDIIEAVGYAPARTSNGSPKVLWRLK